MAKEIERKFLVKHRDFDSLAKGVEIRQGYLASSPTLSVRVRTYGDKAFVTIKGATKGASRDEYEYEIPPQDAREILDNLSETKPIDKIRYRIPAAGHVWGGGRFRGGQAS